MYATICNLMCLFHFNSTKLSFPFLKDGITSFAPYEPIKLEMLKPLSAITVSPLQSFFKNPVCLSVVQPPQPLEIKVMLLCGHIAIKN